MDSYLKCYQVVMHTVGPVFIGSGKEIGKKEYLFFNQNQAGVLDIEKFYQAMAARGKTRELEEYLLGNSRDDLTVWLRKQKIRTDEIRPLIRYALDCSDTVIERGTKLQVMECMKDVYGCPYIPGSTLKGMFRTILLGSDIMQNPSGYQKSREALKRNAARKTNRSFYLSRDIAELENTAFRTLGREKTRAGDAVNDCLQGFLVSDSQPLSVSSLVLCQKIERHTNGIEKNLPLLRECIKPGTEIRFTITIDTNICKISVRMLMDAVKKFMEGYYHSFAAAFSNAVAPRENDVLLGGGCGFVSKTVIYPMFGKKEGIGLTQQIFDVTLGKLSRTHKHNQDRLVGASPHILKCTKYNGKTMQMGLCRIKSITPESSVSRAL